MIGVVAGADWWNVEGGEWGGEGRKGGKSGKGKLLGGGALLNAGPAHRLLGGGEGPLESLGGELVLSRAKLSDLSACFSRALRGLWGDED
jgi:hypothetical protein